MVRRNNHRLNGAGWGSANKVRLLRSLAAFRSAGERAVEIGSRMRGSSASATSRRRPPAILCDSALGGSLDELQPSALILRHPVAEQAARADVGVGPQLAAVAAAMAEVDALLVGIAAARPSGYVAEKGAR